MNTTTAPPLPDMPETIDPNSYWSDAASAAIRKLAATGITFEAADVRLIVPNDPTHANVPGLVFSRLHRAGVIEPVGYAKSVRRGRRGGSTTLWRGTRRAREAATAAQDGGLR